MKWLNAIPCLEVSCSRWIFFLALGLILNGLSSVSLAQDETSGGASAPPPETHQVKASRLKLELKLDGTFESGQSAELKLEPEEWAKLSVKSAVSHGAAVRKGEVLVTLDLEDLEKAIQAAEQAVILSELSLQEAQLSLQALQKTTPIDLAAAERAVREAQADLDYFLEVTKGQSIKSAEFALKGARYSLEYAEEELNQLRQMYKADDLTEETEEIILKRAERGVVRAKFSLESSELATKKTLEVTIPRKEQSLKDATTKQLADHERAKASLMAALQKAEIALEKQQIEHRAAEEKLAHLKADQKLLSNITSPIDGYVFYGPVKKGTWAGKGTLEAALRPGGTVPAKQVFMTVVAPGASRFYTSVSEKDLFQVHRNLTGKVKAVAFPEEAFAGTVESVSRIPSSPGAFDCVVNVAGAADTAILSGMKGSVTITTFDKKEALLVPKSAVFSNDEDDTQYVFVLEENHRKQTVETGRTKGDNVEIRKGLKAGDRILLKKP